MSPTPIRDPNAPPDPRELREIPDHQHVPLSWGTNPHNPVPPVTTEPPTGPEPPAGPPVNVDKPYAAGPDGDATAVVGDEVTVTMGNWDNAPDTYEYLWKRRKGGSTNALAGETDPSYVTVSQDGGQHVFCTLLVKNAVGQASIDSNEIAVSASSKKGK